MPYNPTDQCTDIQPRLAAYALGEVEADTDMLDHLAICSDCQRDLRAYVQVTRMLLYDTSEATPPPALRERILALAADAPLPPRPAAPPQPPLRASVPSAPSKPRNRRVPALWPALAFAVATLIALLGWNISLQRQINAQASQITASRESWGTMIVLLNDPAVRWYPVVGDIARGHFWANPQDQIACLVAQELPDLTNDQVYQVWLVHGDERTSGGVFEAHNGNAWILIQSGAPLAHYDSVGVTIEPHGGSRGPTGQRVLRGDLIAAQEPSSADRQGMLRLLAQAKDDR